MKHDILVRLDGERIEATQLPDLVRRKIAAGFELEVLRKGRRQTVRVEPVR
jgi:hypothetical protein